MEYSRDILSADEIVYESNDLVLCSRARGEIINPYILTEYKSPFAKEKKLDWLSAGSWYQKEDGYYYDSDNYYGNGLGVVRTIEEMAEVIRTNRMKLCYMP